MGNAKSWKLSYETSVAFSAKSSTVRGRFNVNAPCSSDQLLQILELSFELYPVAAPATTCHTYTAPGRLQLISPSPSNNIFCYFEERLGVWLVLFVSRVKILSSPGMANYGVQLVEKRAPSKVKLLQHLRQQKGATNEQRIRVMEAIVIMETYITE